MFVIVVVIVMVLVGCSVMIGGGSGGGGDDFIIKIGYVMLWIGFFVVFGEVDSYVLVQMIVYYKMYELMIVDGMKYKVEIIVQDMQFDLKCVSQVVFDLILKDNVLVILVLLIFDMVNLVFDQCEVNQVFCILMVVLW